MGSISALKSDQQQRTALLDANILLLAISVQVGFSRLKTFSRLQNFDISDGPRLQNLLKQFKGTATTAYVLAEVSNLANKLTGSIRAEWYTALSRYTLVTGEAHVPTQTIGRRPEVVRFGIADAALTELAESHVVITNEFRLAGYLESLGLLVINFNHVRSAGLR